MDSLVEIFLERANNEVLAAQSLKRLSEEAKAKQDFEVPQGETFYSSVISHSYYAIFYSAKALLLTRGIRTMPPDIHINTYEAFKEAFVDTGVLDVDLLEIYRNLALRADDLLGIFRNEKWKRGKFTYRTIPQANREPAEDSLENARVFVSNITRVIRIRTV